MNIQGMVGAVMAALPSGTKGAVVFSGLTGGAFTRSTESVTGQTSFSFTANNVSVSAVPVDRADPTLAVDRQRRLIVAGSECTTALDVTHAATFGGHTWRIAQCVPVTADGATVLAYDLVVAR